MQKSPPVQRKPQQFKASANDRSSKHQSNARLPKATSSPMKNRRRSDYEDIPDFPSPSGEQKSWSKVRKSKSSDESPSSCSSENSDLELIPLSSSSEASDTSSDDSADSTDALEKLGIPSYDLGLVIAQTNTICDDILSQSESLASAFQRHYNASPNRQDRPDFQTYESFLKAVTVIPFYEQAKASQHDDSKHFVALIDKSNGEFVWNWVSNTDDCEQADCENKDTLLALKAYFTACYGPAVTSELTRSGSDFDLMLKANCALTRTQLDNLFKQAEEAQLQQEFVDARWANGRAPISQPKFTEAEEHKIFRFFYDIIDHPSFIERGARAVYAPVDSSFLQSEPKLTQAIENKRTIIAFMAYLEIRKINQSVCTYIWRKYFDANFNVGTQTLSPVDFANIYHEAKALHDRPYTRQENSETIKKQFEEAVRSCPTKGSSIESYKGRWKKFITWIKLGETRAIPKTREEAEQNQQFVLDMCTYIAYHSGRRAARQVWQSQLIEFFKLGIRPGASDILPLLKEAEQMFQTAELEIKSYSETYLKNTPEIASNIFYFPADKAEKLMTQLKASFEAAATIRLLTQEEPLSIEQMHQIRQRCHAGLCAAAAYPVRGATSKEDAENMSANQDSKADEYHKALNNKQKLVWYGNDNFVSIQPANKTKQEKDTEKSLKDRIASSDPFSLLATSRSESDAPIIRVYKRRGRKAAAAASAFGNISIASAVMQNASVVTTVTKYTGNMPGYIANMINSLGILNWIRADHELNRQEIAAYLFSTTAEPQAAALASALFGILFEIHNYRDIGQIKDSYKKRIATLESEYRAAAHLEVVCRYFVTNYNELSENVDLPDSELLKQWQKDLSGEMNRTLLELQTLKGADLGAESRSLAAANIAVNSLFTGSSTSFLLGSQVTFLDKTIDADLLLAGAGFYTTGGLLNSTVSGISAYREHKREQICIKAKERIQRGLNKQFKRFIREKGYKTDRVFKAHKRYRLWKWDQNLIVSDPPKFTPKTFIDSDPMTSILKCLWRNQNDSTHALNKVINGGKATVSATTSTVAGSLLITKLSSASTGAAVPATTTAAASALSLETFGSMGVGLALGLAIYGGSSIYSSVTSSKLKARIEKYRQAYRFQSGPYWNELKNKELNLTDEEATDIAYRKLLRWDLEFAVAELVTNLQREYREADENPHYTNALKELLRPYPTSEETDTNKRLENCRWESYVDSLGKLDNPADIIMSLKPMLVPS